jgi:molybdate transport system substrate-binding protein
MVLCLVTCTRPDASEKQALIVFAASSLTDVFTEMAAEFEGKHPGVEVIFNFAGSSQLATQLVEGGQADVFASASERQMTAVITAGRAAQATPFASNRLTIVVPAANPANITQLEDLGQSGILLVLALPGVPVRQYTDEMVARLGEEFAANFYANLVSEEDNVRQVLAKIVLGEADAGVVYVSDVTPDIAAQVQQIPIPDTQNEVALYPITAVSDTPRPQPAQEFIDFVLSQSGQTILMKWGFGQPP